MLEKHSTTLHTALYCCTIRGTTIVDDLWSIERVGRLPIAANSRESTTTRLYYRLLLYHIIYSYNVVLTVEQPLYCATGDVLALRGAFLFYGVFL